jgi:hypothetical protein
MSWLDDLRSDPEGVHRSLLRRLYQPPANLVASFGRIVYRYIDGEGRVRVFVDASASAPLVLLPPETLEERIDEIVFIAGDEEKRIHPVPSLVRWRHMAVLLLPPSPSGAAENPSPLAPSLDSLGGSHDC